MSTINLLIADDHQIIRDGIKLLLADNSEISIISEASNGKEVIDYLSSPKDKIDVVLMDINMPHMDGIEATRIITKQFPDVKVLILSMHADEIYITKLIEAGALGYVLKEIGLNELSTAIKTISLGENYYCREVLRLLSSSITKKKKSNGAILSPRELSIVTEVSKGLTNKEIGEQLFLSSRTIESHRRNIINKLDVKNTAEMIRYAIEKKLI